MSKRAARKVEEQAQFDFNMQYIIEQGEALGMQPGQIADLKDVLRPNKPIAKDIQMSKGRK